MQNINSKTRIEILSTIDELNQYLNGFVTKTSIVKTLTELQLTIIKLCKIYNQKDLLYANR